MKLKSLEGKTIADIQYVTNESHCPDPDTLITFTDSTVLCITTSEWITYTIDGEDIE